MVPGQKRFRVPNFDIHVKSHELLVINTRTFQRLFHLSQLGLAHLVYPFATYTRAAHAIEALGFAQRILDNLSETIPAEGREREDLTDTVRLATLLHDIAHLPYSHTLEDENVVFDAHHDQDRLDVFLKKLSSELVRSKRPPLSLLEPNPSQLQRLERLLGEATRLLQTVSYGNLAETEHPKGISLLEPEKWFMADIVGNTLCADLLAYIKRDVESTGIEKRHGGYRIFDHLTLAEDSNGRTRLSIRLTKAGFRIDVLSAILDILDVRYALMERVIFHHAKCAASAMLARVARLCELTEDDVLYDLGDEGFLKHLESLALAKPQGDQAREGALHVLTRLRSRILHKRVYRVTFTERRAYEKDYPSFSARFRQSRALTEFENAVEDRFRLPRGSVAAFCPDPDMHLKEADVMVLWDKPGGTATPAQRRVAHPLKSRDFARDYPEFHGRIQEIADRYVDLWSFYVFLDPDQFGSAASIQKHLHQELLVKNDPHLEMYLRTKSQYLKSAEISEYGSQMATSVETEALHALLHTAHWDGREEAWPETMKMAFDAAMRSNPPTELPGRPIETTGGKTRPRQPKLFQKKDENK